MGVRRHASGVKQDVIKMTSHVFHVHSRLCVQGTITAVINKTVARFQCCAVVEQLLIQLGCEREHVTAGEERKGTLRVIQGCKEGRV